MYTLFTRCSLKCLLTRVKSPTLRVEAILTETAGQSTFQVLVNLQVYKTYIINMYFRNIFVHTLSVYLNVADRWRVLLKGEQPDYIHAVIANVSSRLS